MKMQITVDKQRYMIKERKDGTFLIVTTDGFGDRYATVEGNFMNAAMWVHEMADNSDIGVKVVQRMCQKFERTVW